MASKIYVRLEYHYSPVPTKYISLSEESTNCPYLHRPVDIQNLIQPGHKWKTIVSEGLQFIYFNFSKFDVNCSVSMAF
jgi:hypothetical protein